MKGIRERGGKVVILDPRRTESVTWADEHVFIRPGGDAAFLLGLLHVLFAEHFVVEELVARRTDGLAELRAIAARFTPERVSAACGVAPQKIRDLARAFARAPRAACYGRVGTSVNEFGCEASWLVDAVNVVTGNLDRPGGVMWATPPLDLGGLARLFGVNRWGRWRSRVRGLPEFGGQLPIATLAEEIETPGDGQIRGLVTIAGNPVLSAPNGGRLERAIAGLDFVVAIDLFVNETSRHAHIILPPVYALERPHIDVLLASFAVRNVAKYSETVVPPAPDTREDWQILDGLARRLAGPLARLIPRIDPDRIVDLGLRLGGLSLAEVRRHPHGMDLGPLRPAWRERVHTPTGRAQLTPPALVDGI
jgi:anaerobic selenocysteine-containing dehydrogenase